MASNKAAAARRAREAVDEALAAISRASGALEAVYQVTDGDESDTWLQDAEDMRVLAARFEERFAPPPWMVRQRRRTAGQQRRRIS